MKRTHWLWRFALVLWALLTGCANTQSPTRALSSQGGRLVYDVREYGAAGDGKSLDSPAINKAIDACNAAGGGTVYFPAGTYRSFSIRLKSNVCLYLDQSATI